MSASTRTLVLCAMLLCGCQQAPRVVVIPDEDWPRPGIPDLPAEALRGCPPDPGVSGDAVQALLDHRVAWAQCSRSHARLVEAWRRMVELWRDER